MKLKEKMLIKELGKYINSDLFDIILNKNSGKIECILKTNFNPLKLNRVKDKLNNQNVLFKLTSINELKSKVKNSNIDNYESIKYIFNNIPNFQNNLKYNLFIKGDADVAINGIGFNTNTLKVDARNIEIADLSNYNGISVSKVMPYRSLNFIASDSITIDKSSVGLYDDCSLMQLFANRNITLTNSKVFVGSGNLVLFSEKLNLINSCFGCGNLYLMGDSSIIEDTEIKAIKTVDVKANRLSIFYSSIKADNIVFSSDDIRNSNDTIVGEKFTINNIPCTTIERVIPKENEDEVKLRKQLVYTLREIQSKKS